MDWWTWKQLPQAAQSQCFILLKQKLTDCLAGEAQHESRPRAKAEIRNPKTISKVQEVQRYQPAQGGLFQQYRLCLRWNCIFCGCRGCCDCLCDLVISAMLPDEWSFLFPWLKKWKLLTAASYLIEQKVPQNPNFHIQQHKVDSGWSRHTHISRGTVLPLPVPCRFIIGKGWAERQKKPGDPRGL